MDLMELKNSAARCNLCELHKGVIKPVFAKGNPSSKVVVCGMCPGYDENKEGTPFVGKSGQLLDEVLKLVTPNINDVYITNLVKCFVQPGKKLDNVWMDSCLPYLQIQLSFINPKVIIGLGKDVCNYLLGIDATISTMRQTKYTFINSDFVCTYHPSYLVRGGGIKHPDFYKIVEDFKYAFAKV